MSLDIPLGYAYCVIAFVWISMSVNTYLEFKYTISRLLNELRHNREIYDLTLIHAFLMITFAPIAVWVDRLWGLYTKN